MKIKNEIENFIIYHCGSSEKDKTYLLNSLDQYIDNCHIINDVGLLNKNLDYWVVLVFLYLGINL